MGVLRNHHLASAVLAATIYTVTAGPSFAFSLEPPGFTTGLPVYAQLPANLYLVDVPQYGVRDSHPSFDLGADSPFFFLASNVKILGAQLNVEFSPTLAFSRVAGGTRGVGLYNNYLGAGLSWDLGNGWFGGLRMSGWVPIDSPEGYNFGTLDERFGVTYLKNGTNFTANFILNEPLANGAQTYPQAVVLDLTLTQRFKQFEFGAIAFGSTDISAPFPVYQRQSQFAVGALVGYDFGPVNVQAKFSSDVVESGYGGRDRRVWANIIVPLFNAAAPAPPPKGGPY